MVGSSAWPRSIRKTAGNFISGIWAEAHQEPCEPGKAAGLNLCRILGKTRSRTPHRGLRALGTDIQIEWNPMSKELLRLIKWSSRPENPLRRVKLRQIRRVLSPSMHYIDLRRTPRPCRNFPPAERFNLVGHCSKRAVDTCNRFRTNIEQTICGQIGGGGLLAGPRWARSIGCARKSNWQFDLFRMSAEMSDGW